MAVTAVLLLAPSAGRVAAQADGLFADVEPALTRQFPDGGAAGVRGITTTQSRLVTVDTEHLAAARGMVAAAGSVELGNAPILTLNLFDDVVLSGVVEATEPTASGTGYVLFGRVDGVDHGTLTLLVYEEGLVGTVRTATANYDIRPIGDGVHAIRQVDTSMLPPESEPLLPPSPFPDADAEDPPISSADDGSVIDVAVFYTGAARTGASGLMGITGITGLVDKMVADTNFAFRNSGVTQRIRLVRLLIGYARVSTGEQTTAAQVAALKTSGCELIFRDNASGGRWDRPELHKLLSQLRKGDVLVVWTLDHLSRSLRDVLTIMERVQERHAGFRSLKEAVDTTTPAGRMMMQMVGAFAEFERAMLKERTKAGLDAARKEGRIGGRPPKLKPHQQQEIVTLVKQGKKTAADAARLFGVHPATVSRLLRRT